MSRVNRVLGPYPYIPAWVADGFGLRLPVIFMRDRYVHNTKSPSLITWVADGAGLFANDIHEGLLCVQH